MKGKRLCKRMRESRGSTKDLVQVTWPEQSKTLLYNPGHSLEIPCHHQAFHTLLLRTINGRKYKLCLRPLSWRQTHVALRTAIILIVAENNHKAPSPFVSKMLSTTPLPPLQENIRSHLPDVERPIRSVWGFHAGLRHPLTKWCLVLGRCPF